jgi:hypothetical protein
MRNVNINTITSLENFVKLKTIHKKIKKDITANKVFITMTFQNISDIFLLSSLCVEISLVAVKLKP